MDEERSWDEESVSLVGLRVVAIEPLEVMVRCMMTSRARVRGIGCRSRQEWKNRGEAGGWNEVRDAL